MEIPKAEYMNIMNFSEGFHSVRYKEGLTQDLTTFSTHRGNMKWRVQSMGHQSSSAVYVAMVTDSLNCFGLCGGSLHDASKLTDEGREMHRIFSSNTQEYGDWIYREDEKACAEDDWHYVISYVDDTINFGQDLRQADRRLWMLAYACMKSGIWF